MRCILVIRTKQIVNVVEVCSKSKNQTKNIPVVWIIINKWILICFTNLDRLLTIQSTE